jgi:hypothetical protein
MTIVSGIDNIYEVFVDDRDYTDFEDSFNNF